jgi:two-component system CheB/CheR fusion protein
MGERTIKNDMRDIGRLSAELIEVRRRLDEAEQALEAIQRGQLDSLVVHGPEGPRVFSLERTDHCYRVLVEAMNEGAATLSEDWTVLYCNSRFADILDAPLERVMGSVIHQYLAPGSRDSFALLVSEAHSGDSRGETEFISVTGKSIPAFVSLSLIHEGASSRLCIIAADLRAQKRTEEIFVAERLARSVIEQAAEAIIVCDDEGRIIRAGAAAERLCGANPLRRCFDEVYNIELSGPTGGGARPEKFRVSSVAEAAARGRVIRAVTATLIRPDASKADLLLSATILRGGGTRAHGCVINLVDVSDYKRAQEALRQSEERFRIALRNSPVNVSTQDLQFRYTWQHNAFFGRSDETVLGKTDPELLPPQAAARVLELKQRAVATGEAIRDIVSVTQNNEELFFDLAIEPQRDSNGSVIGVTNVVIEVTERKRAEQALREANLQLADADRRKNDFLAMLSHELRNPLSTITNSLYVLERSAPGSDKALRAQVVISRQAGQLSRLVDDLLDATRFSRNKIRLKRRRIDLNHLVQQTTEDHVALFERGGVQLNFVPASGPVHVNADQNRVAQVVGNLLQNAAKFTDNGGNAEITVWSEPPRGEAVIHVADTGAGIAPEVLDNLFVPFMQAEQTLDRTKGGLGLGLALVHALVELHGGSITAYSAGIGKGAEFTVRLPLDTTTTDLAALSTPDVAPRRRILIVEDNVDAAETLRDVLEFAGHDVQVAYDANQGLERARDYNPEVVLCDIGLPGMDGYDFARTFRAEDALSGSILVALTGYAMPEDLQRATKAGFDRHLAKPASFEKIDELMRSLPSGCRRQAVASYPDARP